MEYEEAERMINAILDAAGEYYDEGKLRTYEDLKRCVDAAMEYIAKDAGNFNGIFNKQA